MSDEKLLSVSDGLQNTSGKEVNMFHEKCFAEMEEGNKLLERQLEAFRKKIDAVLQMQNSLLAKYAEKAENYHKDIMQLKREYVEARKEDDNRKEWCDKQRKICNDANKEILKIIEETSSLEHEMEREEKKGKELQKLVQPGELVHEKAMEMEKATKYFQQNLALKLKRTIDGQLAFIFTQINCNDKDQEFVFEIKVVEDSYILTNCKPALPNLKEMLKTLNETNDLQKFVYAIREAFKETCTNKNH